MKKHLYLFTILIILMGVSCTNQVDVEAEKEAIKAVIENESNSHLARDFEQQSKSFLQDESFILLAATSGEYYHTIGWEDMSSVYKYMHKEKPVADEGHLAFKDYKIKVYKESAFAQYDEIVYDKEGKFLAKNISVRFLEKVSGEWKIVYLSFVSATSYED